MEIEVKGLRELFEGARTLTKRRPLIAYFLFVAGLGFLALFVWKEVGELRKQAEDLWRMVSEGSIRERLDVAVAVGALLVAAFIVLESLRRLDLPRPAIEELPDRSVDPDLVIRWAYPGAADADRKYEVRIAREGSKTERKPANRPFLRVPHAWGGVLRIRVRALQGRKPGPFSAVKKVEYYPSSVARVLATGQLSVAIHADRSAGLFCYEDVGGDYQGFDIELMNAIASKLTEMYRSRGEYRRETPIEVIKRNRSWPEILDLPGKLEGIDAAIASISITEDRLRDRRLIFSNAYCKSRIGVICVREPGKLEGPAVSNVPLSPETLRGLTVAAHRETTALSLAKALEGAAPESAVGKVLVADTNEKLFGLRPAKSELSPPADQTATLSQRGLIGSGATREPSLTSAA